MIEKKTHRSFLFTAAEMKKMLDYAYRQKELKELRQLCADNAANVLTLQGIITDQSAQIAKLLLVLQSRFGNEINNAWNVSETLKRVEIALSQNRQNHPPR